MSIVLISSYKDLILIYILVGVLVASDINVNLTN